jgi:hypothetical protein
MTLKNNPEILLGICETIASGILAYSRACRANGVSETSFWSWIKQSQQDPEAITVEFLGETLPFCRAVNAARRIALHEMRGRFEQKNVLGYDEPIFFQGMPTWKPDPRCVGMDEDLREMLGYRRDGLLEDNGKLVQNVIHHDPPVAAVLRTLEVAFPSEYRQTTNQNVNLSGNITAGVTVAKPRTREDGPPPLPTPPRPLAQLVVIPQSDDTAIPETEETAIEPDSDVTDTPAPTYSEEDLSDLTPPAPEPVERVIREAVTVSPPTDAPAAALMNRVGISDLERDLIERAKRAAGTRSNDPIAPIAPIAPKLPKSTDRR